MKKSGVYFHASLIGAIALSAGAYAQPAQQGDVSLEEIVVTGSRVITNGVKAPTPVTVVSTDIMQDVSPGDKFVGLTQLPVFQGSSSPATASFGTTGSRVGGGFANLRGLGGTRTLVLLNGNRVVPSSDDGSPDVSLFPSPLISRVDIVTGGASAAYGSDAVSGVVNFVLDTDYTGLKGELQAGISDEGDKKNYMGNLVYGTEFGPDGRGHIVVAGEYSDDAGLGACDRRIPCEGWAVVNNGTVTAATATEANPLRVVRPNAQSSRMAIGGLIYGGQAGVPASISNVKFGPGGTVIPFVPGANFNPTTMVGGNGDNGGQYVVLYGAREAYNAYTNISYEVTDNTKAYIEGSLGHTYIIAPSFLSREAPAAEQFTIFRDNVFMPAAIRNALPATLQSFQVGRLDRDFLLTPKKFDDDTSPLEYTSKNDIARVVAGFETDLGDEWSLDGHASHGRNKVVSLTYNNPILERTYLASDAVVNPANGQPICRIKLQNPNSTNPTINLCEPLNIFGEGSPSRAALGYILGTARAERINKQTVAEIALSGKPFETWAGPVGFAIGGSYRKEVLAQDADPISKLIGGPRLSPAVPAGLTGRFGGFRLTNTPALSGRISVKEAFTEFSVPLAKDQAWAEGLDLSLAARYADYNTSGGVTTWKAGLVYEPGGGLRFRGTRSRDIRAGNMFELFDAGSGTALTVNDPFLGGVVSSSGQTISRGNVNLRPEKADTTTVGITYQPEWLDGVSASVDYYRINIKDAITALGAQNIVNQCFAGSTFLCPLIQRLAPAPGQTLGTISFIDNPRVNAAAVRANGVDFELGYDGEIGNGNIAARLLTTYTAKRETETLGAAPIDLAGSVFDSAPKWRSTLTLRYDQGPMTITLSERYIGSGKYDVQASTLSLSKSDNHVGDTFYTNITGRYRIGAEEEYELFLTINNLFDQDPHKIGQFSTAGTVVIAKDMYDYIGRAFTTGVRFKF